MINLTLSEMSPKIFFYEKFCFKLHITPKADNPEVSALAESAYKSDLYK